MAADDKLSKELPSRHSSCIATSKLVFHSISAVSVCLRHESSFSLRRAATFLHPALAGAAARQSCCGGLGCVWQWPEIDVHDPILTLKVGSSFKKRLRARLIFPPESRDLGRRASDMTGSGTFMDVMLYLQHCHHASGREVGSKLLLLCKER